MQMSFPETVPNSLCRNPLFVQTNCCSRPGGWSQTILQVKKPDVEVLGWSGFTCSVVVRPVGCSAKFSETTLETAYGSEINIQFTPAALVDIPAVSMPTARPLKTRDTCGFVLCNKSSPKYTCVLIIPFNQHLDMPHLSGGWIILAKEKCSLTQIETNF